jgi:protein-disulfide isomerase
MTRLTKTLIAASILTLAAPAFAAANDTTVSPAERAKIESVVHEYLLKNPQVLLEVMQVLQKQQADQAQITVKQTQKAAPAFAKALFHQPNDPIAGNPNGKVTVVEFFDYQCPHCVDMAPVMAAILKANPDLRVVYKEFPIRGPISEFASRAALAANMQGKYDQFSHALLATNQPLTEEIILATAKSSGIDMDKLKKDMDSLAIKNQVQANIKLAQDLKLLGTPAIFVGKTDANGKEPINYIPGQTDQTQLQNMINQTK